MTILRILLCIVFAFAGAIRSDAQAGPDVDFCSLFDSDNKYEGKTISTTARITYSTVGRVDGDDPVLYSLKCNDSDHFADVYFGTKQSSNFLKDLKLETLFIFEIRFVGKITVKETLDFGHLGWSRAQIKIERVKSSQALPTERKSDWPDGEAAAPLTERAKQLDVDGKIFLQSLYIQPKRMKDDISSLLSDDFLFKNNGKTFSKEEYLKADIPIITSWKRGWTSIGITDVKRKNKGVSARGIVKTDLNTPDEKTFSCLLSFTLKDGFWIISSAQLK